ncbi:hypothetical protein [Xenorhabdus hominickii]|uniref:Uncharacterized protein n=1 Tax=Xenorhabdus hominickii TaxID=351679 RepID=A0A2G0Q6M8_XENHO|nr:hypothetical protein [Xenorhabdus hominickii]AOM39367.1 hypothetical protein A9255_01380 [Xenorhabdus hominickii]PHM54877.1 hypothetical protein Xhom_02834 [Xenorhabdus hominickii]
MQVQSDKRNDYPLRVVGFDEMAAIGDAVTERSGDHCYGEIFLLAGLSVNCFLNRSIGYDEMRRDLFTRLVSLTY